MSPSVAHLLISAAHKSSGKTVISLGLSAALHQQGMHVQTFKKGPDYIDPLWLAEASHRKCYNLDFWTQTDTEITSLFNQHATPAEISIIEGNKGLHDGLATDGSNSNAALAKLLSAPVIVVLDTRGTIRGVAPLLLGYQQFDSEVNIAGVILNFVGGDRHETKLMNVLEHYTDIPVIGSIQRSKDLQLVERYLGLLPSNEDNNSQQHIKQISNAVSKQLDLEKINTIANLASMPTLQEANSSESKNFNVKVAYAKDEAFGFYYADDLETFESFGARLIPFDAIHDTTLPDANALFIGGGFPEKRMQALASNTQMKQAIANAIDKGMPAYAECGGLMYLCKSIQFENQKSDMVGLIDAECEMFEKPIGRGYTLLQKVSNHPWPITNQEMIAGHEFHYSKLSRIGNNTNFTFRVKRGFGVDGKNDGIHYKNLLACYAHQRNTLQNQWILGFLEFIKSCG